MKKTTIATLVCAVISISALAEKPGWAGKGKPTAEQKEAHRTTMKAKDNPEEKIEKEKLKGFEKQKEKKSTQIMKESERGSEKGQEARKTRKKWWKFWGE